MKIIKTTRNGKTKHVVLEGEHITKGQLKELLKLLMG